MPLSRVAAIGIVIACVAAMAVPVATRSAAQAETILQPGQYVWTPELAPRGPLLVIVSLPRQRAYVYRNGVRIGVSTVSTGKPGYETPAGIYTILQKRRVHYSNLYDDAPMPYMQRLTWSGVALHAGRVPGYPASHGCVRLPAEFAERLFTATTQETVVVVAAAGVSPPAVTSPGLFAPMFATDTARPDLPAPPPGYSWSPELAPEGPITILLSTSDRRIVVMRNAVRIGDAAIAVSGAPLQGTHAYVLLEGSRPEPSLVVPERRALPWLALSVPGTEAHRTQLRDAVASGRISLPREFARLLYDELRPGATVIATDEPLAPPSAEVTVLDTGRPADE